ncbi:hypothetical protein GCM10027615_63730 [Plantactinospora veratri]
MSHQFVGGGVHGVHGGHPAAVLQDRDPAGQVEDLGEPVRDVQQADAPLLEPAYQAVQQLDLVVGQRRGGLVHDEQPRVEGQRLGDLDDLLLRDAEMSHPGVGRQGGLPDRAEQSAGAAEHLPAVDEPSAYRFMAQVHVLRDGALRQQVELLVDDADAGPLRVARTAERAGFTREFDGALVRAVSARDDLHEGGLPGTVLTDDGVHLARPDVEVDTVEDAYPEEGLSDAPQGEQRRRSWI